MMNTLANMYAYNSWANAQVFAACREVNSTWLDEQAPGTYGTITETLKHLAQVEFVYALMIQDKPLPTGEARDAFTAHDLTWFADTVARLGHEYAAMIANADDSFYDQPLHVPWFDFALTKQDGLLQVLSHSAQHRAQVFSVLGQHGVEVPDLDYVLFVEARQSGAV